MSSFGGAIGENFAILGAIDPAAIAAATTVSSWGAVKNFHKVGAILLLGATNSNLDLELRQGNTSSGGAAKDFSPAVAITQLETGDDNKQAVVSCDAARCMDIDNGFAWFAASVVTSGDTNVFGVILIGAGNRYGGVAAIDEAGVDEIVSV